VWRQLETKGWAVVIVWECQLKKGRLEETIGRVSGEIRINDVALHRERREQYLQQRRQQKEKEAVMRAEVRRLCGVEAPRIRR